MMTIKLHFPVHKTLGHTVDWGDDRVERISDMKENEIPFLEMWNRQLKQFSNIIKTHRLLERILAGHILVEVACNLLLLARVHGRENLQEEGKEHLQEEGKEQLQNPFESPSVAVDLRKDFDAFWADWFWTNRKKHKINQSDQSQADQLNVRLFN